MAQHELNTNKGLGLDVVPFTSAQEAWFWFMDAHKAKLEGAKVMAGQSAHHRPCETVDILTILDRLYRKRRLVRDHLLVLRHYGQRKMPPDLTRTKERKAHSLWHQALNILEEAMIEKGIVEDNRTANFWAQEA